MKPVVPGDSVVLSRGLGYVNMPRTEHLMWDVYHYQTAAHRRPRGWVDRPSSSILSLYGVVYGTMAQTLRAAGDSVQATRADSVAVGVRYNLAPDGN